MVLLGDLDVREEEVSELLQIGRWLHAPHHGRSFAPRVNNFDARGKTRKLWLGAWSLFR